VAVLEGASAPTPFDRPDAAAPAAVAVMSAPIEFADPQTVVQPEATGAVSAAHQQQVDELVLAFEGAKARLYGACSSIHLFACG
jgi:hypothetical protein